MAEIRLSEGTEERMRLLFPAAERESVRTLLRDQCGTNLPFCQNSTDRELERVRFAVLKLSGGDRQKLARAVKLAQQDWRDVLVASGFADDTHAHESWLPDQS